MEGEGGEVETYHDNKILNFLSWQTYCYFYQEMTDNENEAILKSFRVF